MCQTRKLISGDYRERCGYGGNRPEACGELYPDHRAACIFKFYMLQITVTIPYLLWKGKFPFEEMYYVDETLEETLFLKAAQTELTVNLIHSRKINVKAMAEVTMSSDSQVSEEVTTGIESGEQIYTKYQEKQILTLHTVQKRYIPHQRAADNLRNKRKYRKHFVERSTQPPSGYKAGGRYIKTSGRTSCVLSLWNQWMERQTGSVKMFRMRDR